MKIALNKKLIGVAIIVFSVIVIWYGWSVFNSNKNAGNFVSGNGRIEATEINVASKMSGRVAEILVNEGDFVKAGDVLAKMDMSSVEAQLSEAEAQVANAKSAKDSALAAVAQRKADVVMAQATLVQRDSDLDLARRTAKRTLSLAAQNAISEQEADNDRAKVKNAQALVDVAKAQIVTANASVKAANSQVTQAIANIDAADAVVVRLKSDLEDGILKAPRGGRVQFRVVQPGEVVANGGNVLSLVDLNDVYMTCFLPTTIAGKVALGAEAHIILDAAPNYVIPAKVSYVSSVAQFTPKMVETQNEREKLMFRIKVRIDPKLLQKYVDQVKTGLPGVAYVQLNPNEPWPKNLEVKLK